MMFRRFKLSALIFALAATTALRPAPAAADGVVKTIVDWARVKGRTIFSKEKTANPHEDLNPEKLGQADSAHPVADGLRKIYNSSNILKEVGAIEYSPEYLATKPKYIGREDLIEEVIRKSFMADKPHALITGEAGAGKTAMVRQVARVKHKEYFDQVQKVRQGKLKPDLVSKPLIIEVDINNLVAGTTYRGELEEKFKTLVAKLTEEANKVVELTDESGKAVLDAQGKPVMVRQKVHVYLDEVHQLISAGATSDGTTGLGQMFKPFLTDSPVSVIASTTIDESKHLLKDDALKRRFGSPVQILSPSIDEAVVIVRESIERYEKFYGVKFSPEAIEYSVRIAQRYLNKVTLPDPAFDLINSSGVTYLRRAMKGDVNASDLGQLEQQLTTLRRQHRESVEKTPGTDKEGIRRNQQLNEEISRLTREIAQRESQPLAADAVVVTANDIIGAASRHTGIGEGTLRRITAGNKQEVVQNLRGDLPQALPHQTQAVSRLADALYRGFLNLSLRPRPKAVMVVLGNAKLEDFTKRVDEVVFGAKNADHIREVELKTKVISLDSAYGGGLNKDGLSQLAKSRPQAIAIRNIDVEDTATMETLLEILNTGKLKVGDAINPTVVDFQNMAILLHFRGSPEMLTDVARENNSVLAAAQVFSGAKGKTFKEPSELQAFLAENVNHPGFRLLNEVDGFLELRAESVRQLSRIVKSEATKIADLQALKDSDLKIDVSRRASLELAKMAEGLEGVPRALDRRLLQPIANLMARGQLEKGSILELGFSTESKSFLLRVTSLNKQGEKQVRIFEVQGSGEVRAITDAPSASR